MLAQTLAALQGRVFDASGAVVPGAVIRVENGSTGFDVSVRADAEGRYYVLAVPNGRGSPTFGTITRTRLPTGEAGSSRQIQLAARVSF